MLELQKCLLNSDRDHLLLNQQWGCVQLQQRDYVWKGSTARQGVEPRPSVRLEGKGSFTPIPTQPCAALAALDKEQTGDNYRRLTASSQRRAGGIQHGWWDQSYPKEQ